MDRSRPGCRWTRMGRWRAPAWDRHGRQRLLDGVPLGIKDTIDTADLPTELGDPEIFPGRQPDADAPVVSQARALGFNVLGKNTVSRHAIMLPGPARNPHDLTRTPAASSAGSAAAVADFMAPLSVGTQTAGSILRPSAFCGAVGFKPTLDAIPYVGIRRYSRPLDVIGPIARSVADAALFMRAFTGDPVTTRNRRCATISASACGAQALGRHGARHARGLRRSSQVAVARGRAGDGAVHAVRVRGDGRSAGRDHGLRPGPRVRDAQARPCRAVRSGIDRVPDDGRGISASEYAAALDAADACRRAFHDVARDVDALAMPSTLGEAPPASSTGSSAFIRIWSLLHNPSITLPAARGPNGLPLGFQLVGFVRKIRACCTGRVA